jgi:hypothetical protein
MIQQGTRLSERREEVLRLAAKYGARHVRVFGSVARGEADAASDIDFLVEMEPGRSLLDLGGLQAELEILMDRPVDVVTEKGLKRRIRARVLAEALAVTQSTRCRRRGYS